MNGGNIINERLQKIDDEIVKTKAKIATLTAKLRKLKDEKIERKKAEIFAVVNIEDITAEELEAFLQAKRGQSSGNATETTNSETIKNDKGDTDENI